MKHYGSTPPHWPLDGEAVHVHGFAHGKQFTSDFPLAEGHYIPLGISMNTQHDTLQKPSENMFSSIQASCDIHEMQKRFTPSSATINAGRPGRRPVIPLWF